MLYTKNLDQKIFNAHQYIPSDELIILSGFVGPTPIHKLSNLSIKTTVIYGMYGSASISQPLHKVFLQLHQPPLRNILYSNLPVHSKWYIWKYKGEITYALVGSADFSTNGLTIPYRETLAETSSDTFPELDNYIKRILNNSVSCNSVNPNFVNNIKCEMVLYDPRTGEVPLKSGLNWGNSENGHTKLGDSYIPIRSSHIRSYPNLFPPKQNVPTNMSVTGGKANRQNDSIELIWDDGTLMEALLEGSQNIDGNSYPKQLSSFPSKNTLGVYIRKRLGLAINSVVTTQDLENYGKSKILIQYLQEGTYYIDFSSRR